MARRAEPLQDDDSSAWPEPEANPHLVGHEAALDQIAQAEASSRMAHAWLVTGPSGIGKTTLVYHLTRRLFGETGARLIAAGSHPNLMVVRRSFDDKKDRLKAEIPVDDARRVVPFLRMTASDGGWRVALIDGADSLNIQGQNAILKILEEPPAKSLLFLTATGAGRLLPTIRSRCRVLALQPLADGQVADLLRRYAPDLASTDGLVARSRGSIGMALRLAADSGRGLTFAVKLDALLAERGHWPSATISDLAVEAAKADGDFMILAEEILETTLGHELGNRARGKPPHLLPHLTLESLLTLAEKTGTQLRGARDAHLDLRLTWLDVLRTLSAKVPP